MIRRFLLPNIGESSLYPVWFRPFGPGSPCLAGACLPPLVKMDFRFTTISRYMSVFLRFF